MRNLLFIFSIFCSGFIIAQNKKIDSLLILLKTDKEDSNKVKVLNELGWQLLNNKASELGGVNAKKNINNYCK